MSNYINKDGLLNKEFFTPISNEDFNKQWYVISNNTSWCNVDEAVLSGPYTIIESAIQAKPDDDKFSVEVLSEAEAHALKL